MPEAKMEHTFTIDWISKSGGSDCHFTLPRFNLCCHIFSHLQNFIESVHCCCRTLAVCVGLKGFCKCVNFMVRLWMPQVPNLESVFLAAWERTCFASDHQPVALCLNLHENRSLKTYKVTDCESHIDGSGTLPFKSLGTVGFFFPLLKRN